MLVYTPICAKANKTVGFDARARRIFVSNCNGLARLPVRLDGERSGAGQFGSTRVAEKAAVLPFHAKMEGG